MRVEFRLRRYLGSVLLFAFIAAHCAAYDHPLGSTAIRNAYFLGSSNGESVKFLSTYKQTLPPPKTGPYIAEMEVRTPYAQVVVGSREHSVGYSPMSAEQDYKKNPNTIQVRVQILSTATFVIDSPVASQHSPCQGVYRMNSVEECFHDFRFRFRQGENIKPKSSYGVPIYSGGESGSILFGADIWFTFSTADIASAPLRVTVSTPDGQMVMAEFDLTTLR
jgi:hypothetical protein